ncbi:dihydrolipoamide acetyltransferase family protein [Nonomuraea sp. NPDC050663]|uniref:dihydrolipoamide acetyltransferase family protein n=1 Tax=Nonomuraea sp. NPDC050663 TaxID=3364370 RepID=UPI00378A3F1F
MARLLHMPEVAASAAEAILQSWGVAENTAYAAHDVIATIETEKAVVEVEADSDGVILKTLVLEGAHVEVGAPIALIGERGEHVADLDATLAQLGVVSPVNQAASAPPISAVAQEPPGERIFTSPLARRLAAEAGIPIEEITGTGPHGRILRKDVEAAVAARAPDSRPPAAPRHRKAAQEPGAFVEIPHTRTRRAIAALTTESKQSIPHFYLRGTARVDDLFELRRRLNDDGSVRISVNDLVIKAVACAHALVPTMNVIWTDDAVRSYSSVDVAVAVSTERGLAMPVLRSVERMSVSSVATTVQDFVARARSGKLRPTELEGGTIGVSNLGMYGTEEFAAIISPPQVAILAVGAARQEPVVKKDSLEVGRVMRVTLSVDHRGVDGALAAEWMKTFLALIENPLRILT